MRGTAQQALDSLALPACNSPAHSRKKAFSRQTTDTHNTHLRHTVSGRQHTPHMHTRLESLHLKAFKTLAGCVRAIMRHGIASTCM